MNFFLFFFLPNCLVRYMSFSLPDRVKFLVANLGGKNKCCYSKRRRRVMDNTSGYDFLFSKEMALAACTVVGGAALASHTAAAAFVATSCVPIIVPVNNSLIDSGVPISEDAKRSMSHMMMVSGAQLSFGLVEFLLGDVVNGFTHMVMAGVGFYVTRLDGIVLLPSFSVACTIFAGVSALNLVDMILTKGMISQGLPLTGNFIRLAGVCHPILYIASAYYAWKLIEQLREGLLPMGLGGAIIARPTSASSVLVEPQSVNRPPFGGRSFRLVESSGTTNEQPE